MRTTINFDYHKKARSLFQEFKAFALKGNVIDLAVAVVVGGAFGRIVSSLANNIIMPLFGAAAGGVNFSDWKVTVGNAEITYGVFLQSVVDFAIVAIGIFAVIKLFSIIREKEEKKPQEEKVVEPSEEVKLLREIRDSLKKEDRSDLPA